MAAKTLELIEDGRVHTLEATSMQAPVRVTPSALESALGWTLEPRGLCRGDVCVPTGDRADLASDGGVDLEAFAELIGRPLAMDAAEGLASLGASAREHGSVLASGMAPDFTLPDLDGRDHSLSDYRGKKVLLIAYASW